MRKIALVIGLEYSGNYKLNGCYNDALNIISTIKDLYGFRFHHHIPEKSKVK